MFRYATFISSANSIIDKLHNKLMRVIDFSDSLIIGLDSGRYI